MTTLDREALEKTPISKEAIRVVFESRDGTQNIEVLRTWLKNTCLSHERLRMELEGAEIVWKQEQETVARLRDLLERVEEVFENRPHSDACGCDKCEIYAAVCRVNKETL